MWIPHRTLGGTHDEQIQMTLQGRLWKYNWSCTTIHRRWVVFKLVALSGKEPACQCRRCTRHEFDPWVRKIPWMRAWQHTPIFSPGGFHGQRSLAGYSPCGPKGSDTTKRLTLSLSTRLSDSKKLKRTLFIWGFNQNLESSNTQISKIDGKITQHTKKQKMLTLKGNNNQQTPIPRWHI